MDSSRKTVLIIGSGPAGLTAAYQLLRQTDYKPVILEAEDQVGGISKTICHHENRMDLGGHRFFSKSEEVNAIWRELMPLQGSPALDELLLHQTPKFDGSANPQTQEKVMLQRRRVSRIYFLRKFFDYPISLKPQTFLNMGPRRTLSAGMGYLKAMLHKKEETDLESFMVNRFGEPLYHMFFEDYTEKVWGRHPSDISADWGRQRIRGLSLSKALFSILKKPFSGGKAVETSLIEQFWYPKKGPGQLWETMAKKIVEMGGEIYTNCTVTGLATERDRITGVLTEESGQPRQWKGDFVLSSMPVKDLVAAMQPAAPQEVQSIAAALPYRDFITVGLLVKKLKIQNDTHIPTLSSLVPDCWIYVQEREVKLGRLQIFNNWSPYMVKDLQNTVWIGLEYFCNEGDEMWEQSDEDFIRFATKELASIGIIDIDDVLDSVRVKVKKAYPAYFGSYQQFETVQNYLNTFQNLICIGRNGQHRYNNMDHSMLTALRAVDLIAGRLREKRAIWEVNTEQEYHEEKS